MRPDDATVEVLRLAQSGSQAAAVYGIAETVASRIFPALTAPVAEILAP